MNKVLSMIRFNDYVPLTEELVKLTPAQLIKPNGQTGEARIDILARLVKNSEPLELAKGGTFTVIDIQSALDQIKNWNEITPIALKGAGDKFITSNDLGKSTVFGGAVGGAGGGTLNTKYTESHQCVLLQAMLDHGVQSKEYYTDDILKAAFKKVDVDATIDEVLSVQDHWFDSSYLSAVHLIKSNYVNKSMVFHRGSTSMIQIYLAKNLAFKNSNLGKYSDDKWNPGDIWAIDKSFKLSELNTDSVRSLNQSILKLFVEKRLVGISLKLVKKSAKSKEYNVETPPDIDDHKLLKVFLQGESRGDFWSSKGGTIVYDTGKLGIKDNSYQGTNKVEIQGKTARGGGASWGYIVDASNQVFSGSTRIPEHKFIKDLSNKIAKKKDKKSIETMWTMFNYFYKNTGRQEFDDQLATKDAGWVSAKLGALYLCHSIDNNTGPKANRYITKLINYAGSKSEDSSSYVKVYE
jgi:hypothetical protein